MEKQKNKWLKRAFEIVFLALFLTTFDLLCHRGGGGLIHLFIKNLLLYVCIGMPFYLLVDLIGWIITRLEPNK